MESSKASHGNTFGDLRGRFVQAVNMTIVGGANHYRRQQHLKRLIRHDHVHRDSSPAHETLRIIRQLYSAIRQERLLGKAGHWAYDINRHIGLRQALRAELRVLRKLKGRSS